ncbi:MAG: hexitol phosphatase HxpB [Acidobacteriota bacterium]
MDEPKFRLVQGGASGPPESDELLRAAIFDMDGLLIDSEPLWRQAEQRVFAGVGVQLTDADCEETMGLRIDAVVEHWWQRRPWGGKTRSDVEASILDEVERLIVARGTALPGVDLALEVFAGSGYRLGLASSSPKRLIAAVLDALGLEGCFETVCSAAEEEQGKPDPAVYLTAAHALGALPQRCVALEDSVSGLRAAQAAGMRTIVVPERPPAPGSPLFEADLLLGSLLDLDDQASELVPSA